jgi:hypothetical protein
MSDRFASVRLTAAAVAVVAVVGAACGTTPSTTAQGSVTTTTQDPTTTTTSTGASAPWLPGGKQPGPGCENLRLDTATRADLVRAFGHQGGTMERSGWNFIGRCGEDRYALATVTPPAGITVEQSIAYQDQPTIFVASRTSDWRVVTDSGYACFWPDQPIPKALMVDIWRLPAC